MTSKDDESVIAVLARLDAQIKSGQRKKALKTVDEGLKLLPRDEDLLRTKVYLLVDLDRIQDARALINQHSRALGTKTAFEKAYCLYRLGELPQALEVVNELGSEYKEAGLQLKAQLCYRLGDYENAIKLYSELFSQQKVTGVNVKTNIIAAYTAGKQSNEVEKLKAAAKISPEDGFEVAFNLACSTLQSGKVKEARECLLLALRVGKESLLDEDYTEEQADQELAPLNAQLAYVSALSAQQEVALSAFQDLLSSDVTDEGLRALCASNLNALKLLTSPSDKQRQAIAEASKQSDTFFDKASSSLKLKPSVEQRLSSAQQQALYVNRVLLQLLSGRQQSAKDLTLQLAKRYKDSAGIALLRASLLATDSKLKDAESTLASVSEAEDVSQEVPLMRAQLAVDNANHSKASSILSGSLPGELREKPALIATQAALLEASNQEASALKLVSQIQASLTADRQKTKAEKAAISKGILPIVARLQLKSGAVSEAFKTFKQLHSVDASTASSSAVVGQLAAAALDHDPAAASSLQEHLPSLPEMQDQEIDKLETAGISRMAKGDAGVRASKASGGDTAGKRKRKRKTRLPKNFDPENPGPPPDPERWLPKWQRSEYKKKRRNRKEKSKIGHQGGAVDESLDRTHTETPASAPAPPNAPRRARGRGKGSRR